MATARERSSSSESLEEPSPLPGDGLGKGEAEGTVDSFLLRQQRERMFELRRISHGDRPVSGHGICEKLDAFFRNHVGADSTELSEEDGQSRPTGSQRRTEERRPEAVRLEVRGLFDQHRVSGVLQSDLFRRELENVVRGGLSRFHRSVPPPPLPPPPPQDFNDASSTTTDVDETGSVSSFTSGSTSDVSLHSWLWQVPPPPPAPSHLGMGPPQTGNGAFPPPPSYQAAQHAQPWQQQQQAPGQQGQQGPWQQQQGPWQQQQGPWQQQQGPWQQQQGPWQQPQGPWQQQQGPWQQQQGPWQQQQGPWQQRQGPWQQQQGPWQQRQGPWQQQQQAQRGHRQQPWLQQRQAQLQQQQANRRTLYDIEQAQRENIVSDISELLQQQLVSSSLDGGFRGVLELMVARRVNETGTDGERVQESIQNIPRSRPHRRNDFSHLGISAQPQGAEADGIGAAGIQGPEMQSLRAQVEELKNMVRVSFDLQLDLQRAIRQEVAAAMAAHTGSNTQDVPVTRAVREGHCLICLDQTVDSVLYQCGHMCVCNGCGLNLKSQGHNCPVCRAPIRDVIRAYRCNQD
ncbi:AT-rich interactive domain-containing protein 1A-like [Branchiostoma lanceolatum]|uniref:AT-rich interactive domain-containing protein 1A-like n=1 Tax=Branchiostoma lanceolatum TaxID=7740 RepID=UPI0034555CB4